MRTSCLRRQQLWHLDLGSSYLQHNITHLLPATSQWNVNGEGDNNGMIINGHTGFPPQLWGLLSLEYLLLHALISFKDIFLLSALGATPNHLPLKYRCAIKISNQSRHVYFVQGNFSTISDKNLQQMWGSVVTISINTRYSEVHHQSLPSECLKSGVFNIPS